MEFLLMIKQDTIAGTKNANPNSSNRYLKLEWQKIP